MVWGSFLRCWEMRWYQSRETHLNRQTDLTGSRDRISMIRSSVRSEAEVAPFLEWFISVQAIQSTKAGSGTDGSGFQRRFCGWQLVSQTPLLNPRLSCPAAASFQTAAAARRTRDRQDLKPSCRIVNPWPDLGIRSQDLREVEDLGIRVLVRPV